MQSASGGTGVATALVRGAPILPARPGELSGPSLGVTLEAWGPAGGSVRGPTAELEITRPMPSMPLRFWNDAGGSRHHDSYFPAYPGVRRHGDRVTMTQLSQRGVAGFVAEQLETGARHEGLSLVTASAPVPPHMEIARFRRTRYSASGCTPAPKRSRITASPRSRRFGDRAASAVASASGSS